MKQILAVYLRDCEVKCDIQNRKDNLGNAYREYWFEGIFRLDMPGDKKMNKDLASQVLERGTLKEIIREECIKAIPAEASVRLALGKPAEEQYFSSYCSLKHGSNKNDGDYLKMNFSMNEDNVQLWIHDKLRINICL